MEVRFEPKGLTLNTTWRPLKERWVHTNPQLWSTSNDGLGAERNGAWTSEPGPMSRIPATIALSIHDPRLADGDCDEKKSGFATSLLQGREAAFIHALILVQGSYDYEVLKHEHDGAVVIGEIPDEAVQDAREMSGFHRAELTCKVFES